MSRGAIPTLIEPGWISIALIGPWPARDSDGPRYRLFKYPDGVVRFAHRCDRGDRGVVECAPALTLHQVSWFPAPNVIPSILCPDCGTHGFITDGQWVNA